MSAEQFARIRTFIEAQWDAEVVPLMQEYIKIPNQSPAYDAEWASNGLIEKAMDLLHDWAKKQPIRGFKSTLYEDRGHRTPFLLIEIESTLPAGSSGETVLMYGHMDKQPPMLPWAEGLDPWNPVIRNGRLYGRGGADDGYAICAALLSVVALQRENIPHPRIAVTVESDEESGSVHLMHWIGHVKPLLGDVSLVICLDSGALTWDKMWLTSSLRGVFGGALRVELMSQAIHSGIGSGPVPDSTRVARMLLDRVEDVNTGKILVPELHCVIPPHVVENYQSLNELDFLEQFPLLPGVKLDAKSNAEHALDNYWRPTLVVVGADGIPKSGVAGNVLRQNTEFKLSFRVPPLADTDAAVAAVKRILEADPPYGAKVSFTIDGSGSGWAAPPLAPWLNAAVKQGSVEYFGKSFGEVGLGGSIPFMGQLGRMFPAAQFVVTGVLGPHSNAHGPDEFLDIAFGKGINYCVTRCLAAAGANALLRH